MKRGAPLLLLVFLAGQALAEDDIESLLAAERFHDARRSIENRLRDTPRDKKLLEQRAVALRGQARDLQRAEGYGAAITFLEANLTHWMLAQTYGETCVWAGEEERGLNVLRDSTLPLAERIVPELRLLAQLRRYDEIVARSQEAQETVKWDALKQWENFGRDESRDRQFRLAGATRGLRAALVALAVIGAVAAALYRLAPKRPA